MRLNRTVDKHLIRSLLACAIRMSTHPAQWRDPVCIIADWWWGISGRMESLLSDKFELGGEASVAAGPVGRTTAASTDIKMDAQILTYSRSKGVFGGVSLK